MVYLVQKVENYVPSYRDGLYVTVTKKVPEAKTVTFDTRVIRELEAATGYQQTFPYRELIR